jgi:sugar lactone lactonase YvrE
VYRQLAVSRLVVLAFVMLGVAALPLSADSHVETVVLFDAAAGETPESIVFDRQDNAYISLAALGEIRKVTPEREVSSLALLPIGAPCGDIPVMVLGLAIDRQDRLYAAVSACDPANQGIWRVSTQTGAMKLIGNLPPFVISNGIDIHRGWIYIADTLGGKVWRLPKAGGDAEIWSEDPLLARPADALFPGPNGLKVFRNKVFVANSATGNIVLIPIQKGSAGPARIRATLPDGQGCDEFAFDLKGSIYCTTDPFNTIVRLDRDGSSEILATAADLLDGPTSAAFGRRAKNRHWLYITNAAFPQFTTTFRPSLMRMRVQAQGAPIF